MRHKAGLILGIVLVFLLSGCVEYDVGINFQNQHQGAIVQTISLSKQLTTLNQSQAEQILKDIDKRARQLQGRIKKVSPEEVSIIIPFNNGRELVDKFEQFFNPQLQENQELLDINPEISLQESNLLLLQREKLNILIDLTSLGVFSQEGNLIVTPSSLFNINFSLKTPFGAKNISQNTNLEPINNGNQLVWHLQPGQINEIEVVFWLPSTLGIGTILIILLIIIGFYLKYRRLPWLATTTN